MNDTDRQTLDNFFISWASRYKIVASTEAGLEYSDACEAWKRIKGRHSEQLEQLAVDYSKNTERMREAVDFHKRKADQWLTAYQDTRVKHVGAYTRQFVRRPRMRRLIQFLMRL